MGTISPVRFQAALERWGLGDFVCAEAVSSGLFGQNVFVTSTQGEFVLRGVPHYAWQFPTERFFVEQMHEQTQTPVPHPYLLEPSTDIFGWAFAVMPRMVGISVLDETVASQLTPKDRRIVDSPLEGVQITKVLRPRGVVAAGDEVMRLDDLELETRLNTLTGELEKAQYLEGLLGDMGLGDVVRLDSPDESVPSGVRPNIIATMKGEAGAGDGVIWVVTHMDIVVLKPWLRSSLVRRW